MRHTSQLVVHHPSLIYNVPLIIATLLRHIQQNKLCDPFISVHLSDIPHFATFNHTQNIAHFIIHKVSLQTLRVTRHRKLALFDTSHFAFEYVSQTSSQIFTKLSSGGRIASCDVHYLAN
jgi:hypothetical protein